MSFFLEKLIKRRYKMKRIKFIELGLMFSLLTSAIIFNGCGKKDEADLKIGAILPLTGGASTIGDWHKNGMISAVDKINKEKNIDFEIILEDSKNEGKSGITALKNLNNRFCNVFISAMSGVSVPIIPLVDPLDKPLFVTSVSYPGFTKLGENIYRYNITSDKEAQLIGQYLIKENIKEINLIYINDEYGIGAIQALKQVLSTSSSKITFESSYERNQLDFKNIIDRSKKHVPYYIIGYGNSYISLIKALIERVNKPKILTVYSMDFPEFRKPLIGKDIQIVYTGPQIIKDNAALKKFSNDFYQKFGYEPNLVNILSFDLIELIYEYWKISPSFNVNEIKGKFLGKSLYGYDLIINSDREIQVPLEIKKINLLHEK